MALSAWTCPCFAVSWNSLCKKIWKVDENCIWNSESAPMECFIIYKHMQSPEIKRKKSAYPCTSQVTISTHRTGKHHPVNWTSCFCQFPDGEFRWSPVLPVDPWTHPGTLSSTCQHTGAHGTHRADRGWWGLAGGVEFGRDQNSNFWDFRIKGKSQNWSLTLLCLEVGVWNILGKDNWIAENFTTKICDYLLLFVFVCINLISTQILQFRFVPNECVSENWWHQIQRAQNSCQFRTPNILNSELCERTAKWAKVENPNLAAKRSIVPTNVLGDFLHLYRTAWLPSRQIAWAPVGAHFWNVLNCLTVNVVSTVNSQLHKLLLYKKKHA